MLSAQDFVIIGMFSALDFVIIGMLSALDFVFRITNFHAELPSLLTFLCVTTELTTQQGCLGESRQTLHHLH